MLKITEKGKILLNPCIETKILFVCTGNTCRSPMCSSLFNFMYGSDTIVSDSGGIFADGSPISENSAAVLAENGIPYDNKRVSHNIVPDDIEKTDIVICVSASHTSALAHKFPKFKDKIVCMPYDICDPFGGDISIYRRCFEDIKKNFEMIFEVESGECKND